MRPAISLLTDFGSSDHYVGAMKGVIAGICPEAQLIDISHEVTPFAITEAAYTLSQAWHCFPKGTVHLVVIDPGVGSARRAVLAEAAGHYFVAPDNGVLTMALDSVANRRVREITAARYFRKPVSQTFHGRDIFSPVAAHLAKGIPPARFGKRIEDYLRLSAARPAVAAPGVWTGAILKIDVFGNIVTNFDWESFRWVSEQPFEMRVGRRKITRYATSYAGAPTGQIFVIRGSAGYLEVSANQENAANLLKTGHGASLTLRSL